MYVCVYVCIYIYIYICIYIYIHYSNRQAQLENWSMAAGCFAIARRLRSSEGGDELSMSHIHIYIYIYIHT